MTIEERNELIVANMDLVSKNVNRLLKRSIYTIDEEELTNSLYLAFIIAANNFKPEKNVPFRRYIDSKLSYNAISYLRSIDNLSLIDRRKQKTVDKISNELSNLHHRLPTDEEMADYLKISLDKYYSLMQTIQKLSFYSSINDDNPDTLFEVFEDESVSSDLPVLPSNCGTPEDLFMVLELAQYVIAHFCKHSKKSQLIYILYIVHNFSLRDISELLGVTVVYASRMIAAINKDISIKSKFYLKRKHYG